MRFYGISDNIDTQMGLRLSGIESVVVHEKEEVETAINNALQDKSIGVILITEKLVGICPELFYSIKSNYTVPLIVEIPDRHMSGRTGNAISNYIRNAIGINI